MADQQEALAGYNPKMNTPAFINTVHKKAYPAIDPTQPSLSAAGKTVVITGGATGIGFAIARNFAAAGATTIVLLARRAPSLETASAALAKAYPSIQILTYPTDISDPTSVDTTLSAITAAAHNRSVDILVTSAVHPTTAFPILAIPDAELRANFETNVFGNFDLVRKVLALPTPSPSPSPSSPKIILDVSSDAVFSAFPTTGVYGASKYGFTFLLRHIQNEHPDTVRIHSFHPGAIWTPAIENFGGFSKADIEPILDDADLPGGFAVWLASPQAAFLKGRFVLAKWDVEDLVRNRERFERDRELGIVTLKV
ncbi:hypothetical protein BDV95DRAFT_558082 [Massariosphaeria phaeospora]|uniref:NAD(P)-binding protein n=1 Tax=Massariosphaeria phaeospora TaxID=100035 RepID=A0A7C8IDJ7_9PLEO|nr:hypothetical protein BDV95DRAFT_558082 [Massariosphaeria phaeospora]